MLQMYTLYTYTSNTRLQLCTYIYVRVHELARMLVRKHANPCGYSPRRGDMLAIHRVPPAVVVVVVVVGVVVVVLVAVAVVVVVV